jgi:HlyD family secretion protein
MDRALSLEFKQRQKVKIYLIVTITTTVIAALFFAFKSFIKPSVHKSEISTAIAETGDVEATINASGMIIPEYEFVLTSPVNGRIEKVIHNAGESVKTEESILQLNKESILNQYDQLKDEQEVNKNKRAQLNLNLDRTLNDLYTQYTIKELKIKTLETEVANEAELFEIGGTSKENVKQAELNLTIAERELTQLQNQIQNQKDLMNVELNSLGFTMKIQDKDILEYERKLKLAEIRSPRNGVVISVKDVIGSTVSEGTEVARVADLSSFKVEGSISDSYATNLKIGGQVIVRSNDEDLRGTITQVRPSVENGVIKFIINLQNKNHPSLRSNAKVDVYVVTSFKSHVVRVKNGPAFTGSEEQIIFVVKNGEAIARKVKIGESNFDYIEIKSGIRAGEEVIISDMQKYDHQDRLLIQ